MRKIKSLTITKRQGRDSYRNKQTKENTYEKIKQTHNVLRGHLEKIYFKQK